MKMDKVVFDDLDSLSRGALEQLLQILEGAVAQRGRFVISLSGGHTPAEMYSLWAQEPFRQRTSWDRVHIFWGDERYVPSADPLSNYRMTRETLISHVPIPPGNVHPVPTDLPRPEAAAEAYESELRKFFGSDSPAFDLQLLGLGPEGHTASLFPHSPALEEKTRWVMAVEAPAKPSSRLTLTLPVINRARNTFFLAAGKDKREILAALHGEADTGESQYPAARVRPSGPVVWFLDKAAAIDLPPTP
jgi:6-phosphogluconolactonase